MVAGAFAGCVPPRARVGQAILVNTIRVGHADVCSWLAMQPLVFPRRSRHRAGQPSNPRRSVSQLSLVGFRTGPETEVLDGESGCVRDLTACVSGLVHHESASTAGTRRGDHRVEVDLPDRRICLQDPPTCATAARGRQVGATPGPRGAGARRAAGRDARGPRPPRRGRAARRHRRAPRRGCRPSRRAPPGRRPGSVGRPRSSPRRRAPSVPRGTRAGGCRPGTRRRPGYGPPRGLRPHRSTPRTTPPASVLCASSCASNLIGDRSAAQVPPRDDGRVCVDGPPVR